MRRKLVPLEQLFADLAFRRDEESDGLPRGVMEPLRGRKRGAALHQQNLCCRGVEHAASSQCLRRAGTKPETVPES